MNYINIYKQAEKLIEKIEKDIQDQISSFSYTIKYRIKSEDHMKRKQLLKNYENLDDVDDIIGFRVLLDTEDICHQVYSILLSHFEPYQISNYFENPKPSGFKAYLLKTKKYPILAEIQIMTKEMQSHTEKTHPLHEEEKYKDFIQ